MPISAMMTAIINFLIQFAMFGAFFAWYLFKGSFTPNWQLFWVLPLAVLQIALLGLGVGIIISSLTTKYRDLAIAVGFLFNYGCMQHQLFTLLASSVPMRQN